MKSSLSEDPGAADSLAQSPQPLPKSPPISARPLKRRRHALNWRSRLAQLSEFFRCIGDAPVTLHTRSFFRFVGVARLQEFNPVLQPVLFQAENDSAKIISTDPLPLGFLPEIGR